MFADLRNLMRIYSNFSLAITGIDCIFFARHNGNRLFGLKTAYRLFGTTTGIDYSAPKRPQKGLTTRYRIESYAKVLQPFDY